MNDLTKLEYATIHIYQGMISAMDPPKGDGCECREMANQAINGARILLDELKKAQSNG